jgi:hypothetical protein
MTTEGIFTCLNEIRENLGFQFQFQFFIFHSLAEYKISLTDISGKNDISIHSYRIFPALHESMIQSCQRALNSKPHMKNHIIALVYFQVSYPKNAPFLSKDKNHIESFESFLYKKLANYNNRKNTIKSVRGKWGNVEHGAK